MQEDGKETSRDTDAAIPFQKALMHNILESFEPITLEEMGGIRLMNRTDTKFVTTIGKLRTLLNMAQKEYRIQEVGDTRNIPYYTLYFDTAAFDMFYEHEHGHTGRQKVRIRSYVNSGLNFLEVKTKDNHGRTSKKRVVIDGFYPTSTQQEIDFNEKSEDWLEHVYFLQTHLKYSPEQLHKVIENRFNRITLVNKQKTERLTIDTDLTFWNILSGNTYSLDKVAVIELKRDKQGNSPILSMLSELRIKPQKFSKYCIGSTLTNSSLSAHKFKLRLRTIRKIMESE